MPERLHRGLVRARGWLIPAALLALAPKCLLCVLAYAGVGAALGFGGPELCGGPAAPSAWLFPVVGISLGVIGGLLWKRRQHLS